MTDWIRELFQRENQDEAISEIQRKIEEGEREKTAIAQLLDKERTEREEERKRFALSSELFREEAREIDYLLYKRGTQGIELDSDGQILDREKVMGELKEKYAAFFTPAIWGQAPESKAISAPEKSREEMTYSELCQSEEKNSGTKY